MPPPIVAAPPAEIRLELARDACPSAEAVASALAPLLPETRIAEAGPVVTIRDLGDAFRIAVGPQQRTVSDATRECHERAVTAAVYIALVLDPPALPAVAAAIEPAAPLDATAVTVAAPASPAAIARGGVLALEVAGVGAMAPKDTLVSGGAAARLSWGGGAVAGTLGATALLPVTQDVGSAGARLVRVPIDVGLRLRARRGALDVAGDLGAIAGLLFVRGEDLATSQSATGVELGARAAAIVELPRRAWSPFVALELDVLASHGLVVGGATVEDTPRMWLGLAIGVHAWVD